MRLRPLVVKGYFENPEANARDWDADGYFHTGDIAFCASDSKLWYIVDRKKVRVDAYQALLGKVLTPKSPRSSSKSEASRSRRPSWRACCLATQILSTPLSSG